MKVLLIHTGIDSGGDPTTYSRVIDTDMENHTLITQVISTGYCPWGCDDQEYEDFREALRALPDPRWPDTIDDLIADSTQEW